VYSLAVLNDSSLVSGSGDTTIRVWNITTGLSIRILKGHSDWVYSLAILPNNRLSSGSGTDDLGEIKIWNMNDG
jgi:WD40 repeat protein